jgi:hypothetical protein
MPVGLYLSAFLEIDNFECYSLIRKLCSLSVIQITSAKSTYSINSVAGHEFEGTTNQFTPKSNFNLDISLFQLQITDNGSIAQQAVFEVMVSKVNAINESLCHCNSHKAVFKHTSSLPLRAVMGYEHEGSQNGRTP